MRHRKKRSRFKREEDLEVTKILLIEDNEMYRDMLSRRLEKKGYCVLTANDGSQGHSMAVLESPELILMDIGLPDMDGWEVTKLLKANESTRNIPMLH
jgi:DNA-binding response OmpR family regulator